MLGFAHRTARELRAAGGADVRRSATTELTPQETQIAQMAAQGLSNRQIGEQLFLSHRTVSSHLYRIFPKLSTPRATSWRRRSSPSAPETRRLARPR
jgi:DNA-binding NarL/FixJ family response regulator